MSLVRVVSIEILANHFRCSVLTILNLSHEIEILETKKYIQKSFKSNKKKYSYTDIGYTVPHNVIESLRTRNKSKLNESTISSLPNFLEQVNNMIYEREKNLLSTQVLLEQLEFITIKNENLPFIQFINDNIKLTINKCVVFALAFCRFKKQFSCDIDNLANSIFDDFTDQMEYVQNISVGNNELLSKGILKLKESDFMNERAVGLTENTAKILYKNYPDLYIQEECNISILKSTSIKSKTLYFDKLLGKQVDSLIDLLNNNHFEDVQIKLQKINLPPYITAIFYGQPGTGKTETAYQIAKRTYRDLMIVDLSQLKSKWFGESEKQVKKIFDDYKTIFNNAQIKPILFINEMDGMFTKRMALSGKSAAIDQTMNTIQNIILQELECFEGILFATTNLIENLDNAFERRFLFKIEFKKPNSEISEKIWMSILPELEPRHVRNLSSKYQLSGGEIENIAKKYIIQGIIDNKQLSLDKLIELCEMEKPFQRRMIGFHK